MSGSSWTGRLVSAAVVVLVAALAAATFILSYAGVRDLAVAAGVPLHLARLYPAILDGVLVVACAAAFMLRDSSVWRRIYAWFAVAVLVAVIGAADAIHAMDVVLPKRPAAGTVAALPWALVMLGFSLWLTMLRHARTPRRAAEPVSYPALEPAPFAPMPHDPAAPASPWWAGHPDAAPGHADVTELPATPREAAPSAAAADSAAEPNADVAAPEDTVASDDVPTPAAVPEETRESEPIDGAAPEDAAASDDAAPTETEDAAASEPGEASAAPDDEPTSDAASDGEASEDTETPGDNKTEETSEASGFRLYRVRSTPVPPQD
jgi:hypothetical protein